MKRNININFLKTFGIIAVVLGHCISPENTLSRVIYLINIPVFFIVSGYLYNYKDEKSNNVWTYMGKKIGRFWKYYFIYGLIFVIFRNLFVEMGILAVNYTAYGLNEFLFGFANSALFISNEPFTAAMWFIPVLIIGLTIFNAIISFSMKYKNKKRYIIQILLVLITTFIGYIFTDKNLNIGLHYQTSLFIQIYMLIGYYFKLNEEKLNNIKNINIIKIGVMIFTLLIITTFICFSKIKFDLSENMIQYPIIFITISSLFTISLYYLADFIIKIKSKLLDNKIVLYISNNTISIMCLHIVVFKIIDWLICIINNDTSKLSGFPYSFSNLSIIYTISGISISLIIHFIYVMISKLIRKKCATKNIKA